MPVTTLPDGIPTYHPRHGKFVWPANMQSTLLIHDDYDLFWVIDGGLVMELEPGVRLEARAGEVLLLPPLVAATLRRKGDRLTFWYCHFAFRAGRAKDGGEPVTLPLKWTRSRAAAIRRAYSAVNRLIGAGGRSAWLREVELIRLVHALAEAGAAAERGGRRIEAVAPQHDPRVAQLRTRIENDPAASWRVAELARSVNLSSGHLHALWTHSLGSSIKGYIVRARLRLAMARLRERNSGHRPSVKEVAASCGFSSQHLFCRQFRAGFGITPSAFRDSAGL